MTETPARNYYLEKYSGSLFLIKAGGRVITDDAARKDLLGTIQDLVAADIRVLLVYGGGHAIDDALDAAGLTSKKIDGRRITTAATLPAIKATLAGDLGFRINATMRGIGLRGLCLNAIPPAWADIALREREVRADYGYDGTLAKVYPAPVLTALNAVNFIACPCLGVSERGGVNINADLAAIALASGCQFRKLIFMSDVDGVEVGGEVVSTLTDADIPALIESGEVSGGMQVKLESCLEALDNGVHRIHLLNGLRPGALGGEVYDPTGIGTMILRAADKPRYEQELALNAAEREESAL